MSALGRKRTFNPFLVGIRHKLSPSCSHFNSFETCILHCIHHIIFFQVLSFFQCETDQGRGGCSLEVPSINELKDKLGTVVSSNTRSGFLSGIGSFGSALTVGLCPVCIPAIGAFLASIGLGFIVQESVLRPVLFIFLAAAISGLLWSYLKEHRNVWPLIGGILMGITLYAGRYVYFGAVINQILMYGGITGIIAVSIWNLKLRKSASCPACEVKEPA